MPQVSPSGTPTWRLPADSGQFSGALDAAEVDNLPGSAFAFPGSRTSPVEPGPGRHRCRPRTLAFSNIRQAASYFGVHVTENSWRDLMGSR
jgi:hypothetical protein